MSPRPASFLRFLALALALAGGLFLDAAPASAAARLTIDSGGVSRGAVVVLRDRLKLRRRPLVIVLHRGGPLSAHFRHRLGLEEIAASSRPIFVYPEPVNGAWPTAPGADADRDIKFLRDLVDRLIAQGHVDPRRIFVVGVSSGGAFAYRAVCAGIGHPVDGLATLIAAMPADLANCAPPPTAYIAVASLGDPRIPFAGGPSTLPSSTFDALPAESAFALFAKANGCAARREDRTFPDHEGRGAKSARGSVLSYNGCKKPVELIRIDSGGHRIPGHNHPPETPTEEGDFDSAHAVWDFLKRSGV
jgi:polyhydroxybutyrate depolymerase